MGPCATCSTCAVKRKLLIKFQLPAETAAKTASKVVGDGKSETQNNYIHQRVCGCAFTDCFASIAFTAVTVDTVFFTYMSK